MIADTPSGWRTGWGFDAHRFNQSPPLLLAGVVVSDQVGVDATSDGDVVAHAVTDALLGAIVDGDLGEHFPSSDPAYSGVNSMELLGLAVERAGGQGWVVAHADVTVIVEEVRVGPHRSTIRGALAERLRIPLDRVSVKATTTDGMGFVGAGEGIATVAVVTVQNG